MSRGLYGWAWADTAPDWKSIRQKRQTANIGITPAVFGAITFLVFI
jgi:hypothetical protein